MLPPRCSHPACMNMEVKSVGKSAAGFARKRLGTKAHFSIKGSPPLSSTKKNKTFRAIKAYVTTGTVLSAVLSSPIGNIRIFSLYHGWTCHSFTSTAWNGGIVDVALHTTNMNADKSPTKY